MKHLLIIIVILIGHYKYVAQDEKIDCDTAYTRYDMELCAYKEYKKVEVSLNKVIDSIEKQYASDTIFIKKMRAAQELWEKLRDADIEMKYPHFGQYGSVESMCYIIYKGRLTNDRIEFLRQWLIGEEEGDVCEGSVKTKDN